MDLATLETLLTPRGAAALAAAAALAPTEPRFLACFDSLRKRYPADLAKAALETCILREKARGKYARAAEMFFTREGLEQATAEPVARHRAGRFRDFETVGDFGCGVGGDAISLANVARVAAVDDDPLRLRMAEANAAANGHAGRVTPYLRNLLADDLPPADAFFSDPGRRAGGKRFLSVASYLPPPAELLARFPAGFPAAFKLAPGVPRGEVAAFGGEAEFVSLAGELKECTLWLGPLATCRTRATVLPAGATLAVNAPAPQRNAGPPKRFLYDPDPAISRADLVANLAELLAAELIDYGTAMLTSDADTPTPFATRYEVEDWLPFHARRLGDALKARGVGRVTIVKRNSSADADELLKAWKLPGGDHRFVILTMIEGKAAAVICRRMG